MSNQLIDVYNNIVKKNMLEAFDDIINDHQIPKISKISLNMGVGEAVSDSKVINKAFEEIRMISGQNPVITKAKKSISTFKLRAGMPIGVKVTLRRKMMYNFIEKLIYIVLPKVKDFKGLSFKGFDGNGNYSFGIKEQIIFPEINYDDVDAVRGLNINIETTTGDDEKAKFLLQSLYFPFRD